MRPPPVTEKKAREICCKINILNEKENLFSALYRFQITESNIRKSDKQLQYF